jgi:hypothetical protein
MILQEDNFSELCESALPCCHYMHHGIKDLGVFFDSKLYFDSNVDSIFLNA